MQHAHIVALGDALSAARHDDLLAMQRLLEVGLDLTGAGEVRLLLLDGDAVETWRLERGGAVTLAVTLDGSDDGFSAWRSSLDLEGALTVVAAALPRAPGIDAGLIAVTVPNRADFVDATSRSLALVALHASAVASAARADLERRIAVDAARRGGKIIAARDTAAQLHRRTMWAVSALDRVRTDGPRWTDDAVSHLDVMRELVDELLVDLQD